MGVTKGEDCLAGVASDGTTFSSFVLTAGVEPFLGAVGPGGVFLTGVGKEVTFSVLVLTGAALGGEDFLTGAAGEGDFFGGGGTG